jgi:hypothetical protein
MMMMMIIIITTITIIIMITFTKLYFFRWFCMGVKFGGT